MADAGLLISIQSHLLQHLEKELVAPAGLPCGCDEPPL